MELIMNLKDLKYSGRLSPRVTLASKVFKVAFAAVKNDLPPKEATPVIISACFKLYQFSATFIAADH